MQSIFIRTAGILLLVFSSIPSLALAQASDDAVTAAVAEASPSVVSIVISKDLPKYDVRYVNPFGGDPFFEGIGFALPVYEDTGATERQDIGAGSGFIATKDGYVVTNKHVVSDEEAFYTVVLPDGSEHQGTVAYRDPDRDLALVKIEGTYVPASLKSSTELKRGQTVIAIGNALGEFPNTVSVGIVSGLNRSIEATDPSGYQSEVLKGVIQTDAALSPGGSGGPLVALDGSVVGVNVATVVGAEDISFAIPSDDALAMLRTALKRFF
jgi:serine protease Do